MVIPCNEEQQRQPPRQGHLRVRSGLTLQMTGPNSTSVNIHGHFQQ